MSKTTGETCDRAGTYVATCPNGHSQQAQLIPGYTFPPCGERKPDGDPCGAPLQWELKPQHMH